MFERVNDLIPGLEHHSLLAATAHGLRVYVDNRTGQTVTYGAEEGHPDHLRFLIDLLERKSPKIEDYVGPVMSAADIDDLLGLDVETLAHREQGGV